MLQMGSVSAHLKHAHSLENHAEHGAMDAEEAETAEHAHRGRCAVQLGSALQPVLPKHALI